MAAIGIAELERRGTDRRIRAMHVRVVVDNNDGSAPWQVDTREQLASIDGHGQSCPAFAKATPGEAPIVTIAPGASSTIDLYYPLPRSMQKASEVPEFAVLWRVQTPEALVAERTSFERLRIEPSGPPPGYYTMDGWGPGYYGWSYDPFWPDYAFWGAPVLYSPHPPAVMGAPPARRIR